MTKILVWEKEIEGDIIVEETRRDKKMILFHPANKPQKEVDLLYYNDRDCCWKSECESLGEGYEYQAVLEMVDDDYDDILDELASDNYRLRSCFES